MEDALIVGGILFVVVTVLWSALSRKSTPSAMVMPDEVEEAIRVLKQPRRGPGGVGIRFKVTLEQCELHGDGNLVHLDAKRAVR